MLDKRRFRVLRDFKVINSEGSSILIRANSADADIFAYVPLTDPVVVVLEGRFDCQVSKSIFESCTEGWDMRVGAG